MSATLPVTRPDAPAAGASRAPMAWWAALLALAAFAYLFGLDGQNIPRIGDEMPYAQVTRLTGASGHWLPLRAPEALENTKPPLLFWMGIVATDWGRAYTLERLRLPIVLVTFLVAVVVLLLGRRLMGLAGGLVAAVVFLGWFSTFRYGRPFLTNLPETLFVFAPFACAVAKPERLEWWGFWFLATLALGLACWTKSFALVAPVGLAYSWWILSRRGWRWGEWLRRDGPKLALLGLGGLALFGVWPLVDPDGQAVWDQFVGRENLGKLGSKRGYFEEAFAGPHSLWRLWFGHLANAGLYAPLLVALAWDAWKRRRVLSEPERALWILVLAFLVAYTIPSHRQENYLLPTVPALAVLTALRWQAFSRLAWRASAVATLLAGAAACGFVLLVVNAGYLAGSDWPLVALTVPVLVVVLSLVTLLRARTAPTLFPLAVLLALLSIACVTSPFEGPKGRFPPASEALVAGSPLRVPSNFRSTEETYRFLMPRTSPQPYPVGEPVHLVTSGSTDASPIVRRVTPGAPADVDGVSLGSWQERGRRLTLETRLDAAGLRELFLHADTSALVREDVLLVANPLPSGPR